MEQQRIRVEVAFALADRQRVIALDVAAGTTMHDAVVQSGIAGEFPGLIDVDHAPMGVFGKREKHPRTRILAEGDRVEIYRPLTIGPNEARRVRAKRRETTGRRGAA